jgi:hypothetical protein
MLLNPLPVMAYPDQLLDDQLDELGEVFGDFAAIRGACTIFGADVSDMLLQDSPSMERLMLWPTEQ